MVSVQPQQRISVVIISKDEPALDETLTAVEREASGMPGTEIVVVDASEGRLDDIAARHPGVRWINFAKPDGVGVSIPHQRNVGISSSNGDVIVFTDSGCIPRDGWLRSITAPVCTGAEDATAGIALSPRGDSIYDKDVLRRAEAEYLEECPTINLAFSRRAVEAIGGFDESFEYGSDVDFSWRLREAGYRIRSVPDAVVTHEWGDARRRLRRSYMYGRARAHLYLKHRGRLGQALRRDPTVVVYPLFLLGLPITVRYRSYLLLVLIPLWRNRNNSPGHVLVDHLAYGCGALTRIAYAALSRTQPSRP